MSSLVGKTLAHYRIHAFLGEGGMGAVYRAEDTNLGREVALKVLPDDVAAAPERLSRFRREARAVAALNHPNIVTVYSVEEADSVHFLTMELVEGETLAERLSEEGASLETFFDVAVGLADALSAAHDRGIVHRDIKAANVMVTNDGRTKVLDFGLARMEAGEDVHATTPTQTATQVGTILGTPAYMSPEQACGKVADARSDLFSTGVVFYELLTGERPFRRADGPSTIHAVLHDTPPTVSGVRKGIPRDVAAIVTRCLEKKPEDRYASADALRDALVTSRARHLGAPGDRSALSRWQVAVPLAALVVVGVAAVVWWQGGPSDADRIRSETIPRIEALLEDGDESDAFLLVRDALEVLPDDPSLLRQLDRSSWPGSVESDPPGATVEFRPYADPDSDWKHLGTTPLEATRLPKEYSVFRFRLDGYETQTLAFGRLRLSVGLDPVGSVPEGMVRVPAGPMQFGKTATELPGFWIDRHEVANRAYQAFVDAGGYGNPEHWTETFVDAGRTLSREDAMARFVDATGRPGPAGWELGRYPEGAGDVPVTGIGWYEAAAYARWAGKDLPTVFHWRRAAEQDIFADILVQSNFDGEGPAAAGTYTGIGRFGTYDMAGNAKEWCRNATGDMRYSQGGGWNESPYMFDDFDARSPFDRGPGQGMRLVKYDEPPAVALIEPWNDTRYDFAGIEPVDDAAYSFFAGLYAYESQPLNASVDAVDDSSPHWRRETVTVDPAYDASRLVLWVYLPKNTKPPYQTVIYRPASVIYRLTRIDEYKIPDYFPRSGRALVIPAYWGSLGRQGERQPPTPQGLRDRVIRQVQDYRRALDYVETRDDIDVDRLAYAGLSAGGEYGPIYLATDDRVKAAVLVAAGYHDAHMLDELPEINPWNFSPRVTLPTLVVNGENDFTLPYETAQKPFFDLLGTPDADKRLVLISGGHVTTDPNALIRESLDWLDRYLGPVTN